MGGGCRLYRFACCIWLIIGFEVVTSGVDVCMFKTLSGVFGCVNCWVGWKYLLFV